MKIIYNRRIYIYAAGFRTAQAVQHNFKYTQDWYSTGVAHGKPYDLFGVLLCHILFFHILRRSSNLLQLTPLP